MWTKRKQILWCLEWIHLLEVYSSMYSSVQNMMLWPVSKHDAWNRVQAQTEAVVHLQVCNICAGLACCHLLLQVGSCAIVVKRSACLLVATHRAGGFEQNWCLSTWKSFGCIALPGKRTWVVYQTIKQNFTETSMLWNKAGGTAWKVMDAASESWTGAIAEWEYHLWSEEAAVGISISITLPALLTSGLVLKGSLSSEGLFGSKPEHGFQTPHGRPCSYRSKGKVTKHQCTACIPSSEVLSVFLLALKMLQL